MSKIMENTVPAESQMRRNDRRKIFGKENANKRILILGNSITWHEYKEEIGWFGDWGMASSSEEKDYVHQLCSMLGALRKPYGDVAVMVRQASAWELGYFKEKILENFKVEKDFNADLVVFRLGENIRGEVDEKVLYAKMQELFKYLCPHGKIVLTTGFWKNDIVDGCIRNYANKNSSILVELNYLGEDDKNMAIGKFKHHGVEIHPGDKGMKEIAIAIYNAIKEEI